MTRVLMVSPSSAPGGAERAFAALARRLPEHGYEPVCALLQEGPLEDWLADSKTVILPAGRMRELPRMARTVRGLESLARTENAAVVVSNMAKGHLYGGWAARSARLPAVWWQHGVPRASRIERAAARVPAVAVACVSEASADAQRTLTPSKRLAVVAPGVSLERLETARGSGAFLRKRLGSPLVGIVGRLQAGKGQDLFLRAAAIVSRERPDVRFAVVGGAVLGNEGSYEDDLRTLADDLGVAVHFAGHVVDPAPWLDALDVAVCASSQPEGFGLAVVEAMAMGTPVVAPAEGGPAEIVEDGVSGLLFAPGDPDALARGILRLLDEPGLAAGGPARAREFTEEAGARAFAQLLRDILRFDGAAYWRRLHAAAAPARAADADLLAAVCYAGAPRWLNRHAARAQRRAFHSLLPGDVRGRSALDVGCGTGRWSRLLHERGARVTGVDISPEVVAENRRRLPGIEFVAGDFVDVDVREVDLAVSVTVLQHLAPSAQEDAIAKLGRLVRPGGHALVLENVRDRAAHVFARAPGDWEAAFARAGFELVRRRAYGYDLPLRAFACLRRRAPSAPDPERAVARFGSSRRRIAHALVFAPLVALSALVEPAARALLPDRLAGHAAFLFVRKEDGS